MKKIDSYQSKQSLSHHSGFIKQNIAMVLMSVLTACSAKVEQDIPKADKSNGLLEHQKAFNSGDAVRLPINFILLMQKYPDDFNQIVKEYQSGRSYEELSKKYNVFNVIRGSMKDYLDECFELCDESGQNCPDDNITDACNEARDGVITLCKMKLAGSDLSECRSKFLNGVDKKSFKVAHKQAYPKSNK